MPRGRFLTFEGIEGCGKTTQLRLFAGHLEEHGVPVVTTREPGGTELGERIRDLLLDPRLAPTAAAELFLLEAARSQLVAQVVMPALEAGNVVLCDRFADSSVAYQAGARGIDRSVVERLNALACGGVVPDRTLVFDLDVETALARARRRVGTTPDNRRFEDEALSFHRLVAAAYRDLARREPRRVILIDARGTPDEVQTRTRAALGDLLP